MKLSREQHNNLRVFGIFVVLLVVIIAFTLATGPMWEAGYPFLTAIFASAISYLVGYMARVTEEES